MGEFPPRGKSIGMIQIQPQQLTQTMELRDVIIVSTVVREYVPDLTAKFNDLCAFNGADVLNSSSCLLTS